MKRARSFHQDEKPLERAASRPWPCGAHQTSTLAEGWNNALSRVSNTTYGTTVARDESTVVVGDNYGAISTHHHHYPEVINQPFRILLNSLTFDRIHARLRNVAQALPDTCQWIFDHHSFTTWRVDGGFLWIKGKPGSGKSTIMKEMHAWAQSTLKTCCVLSYFFNARSPDAAENSPLGLYRSILHQFLSIGGFEDGRRSFRSQFEYKIKADRVSEEWSETELQNFLMDLFRMKGLPLVAIFVDALDEGQDDEVRGMIRFLERLTRHARATGAVICICLSSRHYPNFTIRTDLQIVVEDEIGQRKDIETYISSELVTDTDETQVHALRKAVLDRSNGIFLWVVLVTRTLNTICDQGKGMQAMWQKLSSIPNDLHKLFADILFRDAENIDECITLFRWVLFSAKSMSPDELYRIIHYMHYEQVMGDELLDSSMVKKYLVNCSRGLIESTGTTRPVIQFIHESVRDYLLNIDALPTPGREKSSSDAFTKALEPTESHGILAEYCLRYFLHVCSPGNPLEQYIEDDFINILVKHDFWTLYAAEHWSLHAQRRETSVNEELCRLALVLVNDARIFHNWMRFIDENFSPPRTTTSEHPYTSLQGAAMIGIPPLIIRILPTTEDINAVHNQGGTALQIAAERGHEAVVQILLEAGADLRREGGLYGSPLSAAAAGGHEEIAKLLLDSMGDKTSPRNYDRALWHATYRGPAKMVQLLLAREADPNVLHEGYTALRVAIFRSSIEFVQVLLAGGADPNDDMAHSSLLAMAMAAESPPANLISVLVEAGARLRASEEGSLRRLQAMLQQGQ